MSVANSKGERVFVWSIGAICASAYGYVFLFETPGQISSYGILALALGGAAFLFLAAYLLIKVHTWHEIRKQQPKLGTTDGSSKR